MTKIYFNKGLDSEMIFPVTNFNENVSNNDFNGFAVYEDPSKAPTNLGDFKNYRFTSMVILDDAGKVIPFFGKYNYVNTLSVNYSNDNARYSIDIFLTYEE